VDADADVFLGRDYRRQHLDVLDLIVRPAGGCPARLRQCLRAKDIEQGRTLSELAAKIDDPAIDHHAIAGGAAGSEACKFHDCCVRWLVDISQLSLPGLDPAIHLSSQKLFTQED